MTVLFDTNALLWTELNDRRLGAITRRTISEAVRNGNGFICPISYWEVQVSINKKRLIFNLPIEQWRRNHLRAGYIERAITGIDTMLMGQLPDLHGDPADRLVMAVAINAGLTLLTADEKILAWPGQLARMDTRH